MISYFLSLNKASHVGSKSVFKEYFVAVINHEIPDAEVQSCVARFSPLNLSKGDYFSEEGRICPYFCFIENGILQHSISILGEEKTTYLALKNSCTSALKSFKNQVASRKNIRALSDCNLWVINAKDFHFLLETNDTFRIFYHNLIENQIFRIDDYRIDLLTLSPEERYKKLLANEPNLLQEVRLRHLSSFLGISDRHMSRIRKNTI